jgi:hypothetical protein
MACRSYGTYLLQFWLLQRPKSSQYDFILLVMMLVSPLKTFCKEYIFFSNFFCLEILYMSFLHIFGGIGSPPYMIARQILLNCKSNKQCIRDIRTWSSKNKNGEKKFSPQMLINYSLK